MRQGLPAFVLGAGGGVAALGGPLVSAVLLLGLAGGWLMLSAPVLGAYGLVAISHLDGIAGIVDKKLPLSSFKLLTVAVLGVLLVTARRNPALMGRPRPSVPLLATWLFACWLVFSHLVSAEMEAGRGHTIGFLSTLLLVAILGLTVERTAHLRWMALVIVGSGIVSAVLVVLEAKAGLRLLPAANPADIAAWRGEVRPAGASAYNPTTAAHLMLASFTTAAVLALRDAAWRWIWVLGALSCLAALGMMGARSAIIGLGVAVMMGGWAMRRHRFFPVVLALVVLAGLAALPFVPASLWERFSVVADFFDGGNTSDRTLLRRLSYNLIGLHLWSENPLTGVGPGAYPGLYAGVEFRWYPGRELAPRQLHNSYMEVLAETGLVGLALFMTAVFGAVRIALRAAKQAGEAAIFAGAFGTALAAFLAASLFMPNEDNKYLWILVALCARAAWLVRLESSAKASL